MAIPLVRIMRTILATLPMVMFAILTLSLATSGPAEGAVIVLDGSSVQYSPAQPGNTDRVNVTATVLFIDADPGNVTLKWRLCTVAQCGLDTSVDMVRVPGTDMWKATIGPFPEKDPSNEPYIDIQIHVVADGAATDGGEDPSESSPVQTIYFKETNDPIPPTKDDSPLGMGVILGGVLAGVASIVIIGVKRKRHS
jgi:hypothetical protein